MVNGSTLSVLNKKYDWEEMMLRMKAGWLNKIVQKGGRINLVQFY